MRVNAPPRPRVLLADADAPRRAQLRAALAEDHVLLEAESAEDAIVALEEREPGLTLVAHDLPGAAGTEVVARVRDLHPLELVLVLSPQLSVDLCRAAMRAGAYDCLEHGAPLPEQIRAVGDVAARRLEEASRELRHAEDMARAAVRRHEHDAAARAARPAALAAWSAADVELRRRWLDLYAAAAPLAVDDPERARSVREIIDEIAVHPKPVDLWLGLHVHAFVAGRPAPQEGLARAREVLVEGLAVLAERGRPTGGVVREGGLPSALAGVGAAAGLPAWHKWTLPDGAEEWILVAAGEPVARVTPRPGGIKGVLRTDRRGQLVPCDATSLPAALRDVERRLGLPSQARVVAATHA
ncbi:MAG TPA: response regulator [Planctomycetota bacterium]|nr:response regulator [Planctomycetota bacterium]